MKTELNLTLKCFAFCCSLPVWISSDVIPMRNTTYNKCLPDFNVFGNCCAKAAFITHCIINTFVGFLIPIFIVTFCNVKILYYVLRVMNVSIKIPNQAKNFKIFYFVI